MASPKLAESDVDGLYGLPLDDFVSGRDRLARALREEGDREKALEVKALRKPTVAAWAVNQLARREKMRLRSLLAAGERLQAAHRKLLEGGSPRALERARDDERRAIRALADAAEKLLADAGLAPTEPTLTRVRDTLHAAAVDPEVGELVRRGRLARETKATGFGFGSVGVAPAAGGRATRTRTSERRAKQREAARAATQAAEEGVREARRALALAEQAVRKHERALADAERELAGRRSELRAREASLERARRSQERLTETRGS